MMNPIVSNPYVGQPAARVAPMSEVTQGDQCGGCDEAGETESASNEAREAPHRLVRRELSTEDELALRELKARDTEVRAHEQAHKAAGGQLVTGGPTYEYETGPDGHRYAVGGEVSIEVSPESGDPAATIAKAQAVRRAALAPANPSSTDRQVAARAGAMERDARAEIAKETSAPEGEAETDEPSGDVDSTVATEPSIEPPQSSRSYGTQRLNLHV